MYSPAWLIQDQVFQNRFSLNGQFYFDNLRVAFKDVGTLPLSELPPCPPVKHKKSYTEGAML